MKQIGKNLTKSRSRNMNLLNGRRGFSVTSCECGKDWVYYLVCNKNDLKDVETFFKIDLSNIADIREIMFLERDFFSSLYDSEEIHNTIIVFTKTGNQRVSFPSATGWKNWKKFNKDFIKTLATVRRK